jgi:hypothetical protein
MRTWTCKIGECEDADLLGPDGKYLGADWPMRQAIREAYFRVTGKEPQFIFSGWAGELTDREREVAFPREGTERG